MTLTNFHMICLENCVPPALALENDAVVFALRKSLISPSPAADARVKELINSEF